jgi:hypothetical protein
MMQISQLANVATVAGNSKRKILLNDEEASILRALSTCLALASCMGFKALTNPIRINKMATHEGPLTTRRKIGR